MAARASWVVPVPSSACGSTGRCCCGCCSGGTCCCHSCRCCPCRCRVLRPLVASFTLGHRLRTVCICSRELMQQFVHVNAVECCTWTHLTRSKETYDRSAHIVRNGGGHRGFEILTRTTRRSLCAREFGILLDRLASGTHRHICFGKRNVCVPDISLYHHPQGMASYYS